MFKDLQKIRDAIKQVDPNRKVVKVYDGKEKYLVIAESTVSGEIDADPFFSITKNNFKVVPCLPMAQMEWFIEAKKHPIDLGE